jgi:predicted anti-sigma-YlaC factor YlaD
MDISGKECARARESVSADLDRELQELELRRLQAHLRVCADCFAWEGRVRATTEQLREAPFERSTAAVFDLPRRGRAWRVGPAVVVAPVAAVAALAASVVLSVGAAQHGLFGGQRTTRTSLGPTERTLVHNSPSVDMYRLPALHVFRAI